MTRPKSAARLDIEDHLSKMEEKKYPWDKELVSQIARIGDLDYLKRLREIIVNRGEADHNLRLAFETENSKRWIPVHICALRGHCECMKFLVEHCCPSGPSLLERKSVIGYIPIHLCFAHTNFDCIEYIIANAPSGLGVLLIRDNQNNYPISLLPDRHFDKFKERIASWIERVPELFLGLRAIQQERIIPLLKEREGLLLHLIEDSFSFSNLVFSIIQADMQCRYQRETI